MVLIRKLLSQDEMVCSEYITYRRTLPIEEITSAGNVAMDDVIMWIGPTLHSVHENWIDGNVRLLGDAAHPMLQYLAQGGVQALEDAYILGEALEIKETYSAAFNRY